MAFIPVKEFEISISTTASTARSVSLNTEFPSPRKNIQLRIRPDGAETVIKVGDNTVVADKTPVGDSLPTGNFSQPAGQTEIYGVTQEDPYISAIAKSGIGTLFVTVGYGE